MHIALELEKGILFFENGVVPNKFQFKKKKEYKTGLFQYNYELKD